MGIGTIYAVLQLAVQEGGRTPDAAGVAVPIALLLDFTGGIWGGWVASIFLPRVRAWYTAVLGGICAVGPVIAAFAIADDGFSRTNTVIGIIAGVMIGTVLGTWIWFRYRRRVPADTRQLRRYAAKQ